MATRAAGSRESHLPEETVSYSFLQDAARAESSLSHSGASFAFADALSQESTKERRSRSSLPQVSITGFVFVFFI